MKNKYIPVHPNMYDYEGFYKEMTAKPLREFLDDIRDGIYGKAKIFDIENVIVGLVRLHMLKKNQSHYRPDFECLKSNDGSRYLKFVAFGDFASFTILVERDLGADGITPASSYRWIVAVNSCKPGDDFNEDASVEAFLDCIVCNVTFYAKSFSEAFTPRIQSNLELYRRMLTR